jgi:glutamate-1-semialdehyde 2,1-aminomutase
VAAAVRLARAATGREALLHCGYHGWLDWCQAPGTSGVPAATTALAGVLPFDDPERGRALIRRQGDRLAAVVVEPVVEHLPSLAWLTMLREETARVGAVLVFDEIKTGFRLAPGGAVQRFGVAPDLVVLAKALGNGFPLAAVGGGRAVMEMARHTWISSTLATELVSLAAANAVVELHLTQPVTDHLARVGGRLYRGLGELAARHPGLLAGVGGIPEMCFLRSRDEAAGIGIARAAAGRGLLWKRTAYNFVSLAHDEPVIDRALALLEDACQEAGRPAS